MATPSALVEAGLGVGFKGLKEGPLRVLGLGFRVRV